MRKRYAIALVLIGVVMGMIIGWGVNQYVSNNEALSEKDEMPSADSQSSLGSLEEDFNWSSVYNEAEILVIPALDIRVPLYEANAYSNNGEAQVIVDNEHSAALMEMNGTKIIADHVEQDFANLSLAKAGMKAYVEHEDGSKTVYECIKSVLGENTEEELLDENGTPVTELVPTGRGLAIYTCTDNWRDIVLTVWERTSWQSQELP